MQEPNPNRVMEYEMRLYHCHKIKRNVQILEDYEVIDGVRTLVRCSCPVHMGTASTDRHCNGINEFDFPCGYADWQQTK